MTDAPTPDLDANLNQQRARTFIEKIERDRDQALAEIAKDARARVDQIYKQAYSIAREFHRSKSEQVRQQSRRRADRHSARALARLRRETWRALRRLQQVSLSHMEARLNLLCADPERQWTWCRYWLQTARAEARGQALDITLGRAIKPEINRRLTAWLRDYPKPCTVRNDVAMGHGIMIAWGDQLLDGRLEAQHPYLADEVFKRLAHELHDEQEKDLT